MDISALLLSVSDVAPDGKHACIVGDSINLTPCIGLMTPAGTVDVTATLGAGETIDSSTFAGSSMVAVTLVSRPGGSSASVSSGAFTADVVGSYVATVAFGNVSRMFKITAFPSGIVGTLKVHPSNANSAAVGRSALQALVRQPGFTPSALTSSAPSVFSTLSPWPGFEAFQNS